MNFPRGETSGGETAGGVNHPGGENIFYKGVNRPGVNHKWGETSGTQIYMYMKEINDSASLIVSQIIIAQIMFIVSRMQHLLTYRT